MASTELAASDALIGCASFLCALMVGMAFLALRAEQPSESMRKIAEFLENLLPAHLLNLPKLPYNEYHTLVLALCILGIFAFCFTRLVITLRRGYNATSMAAPLILSCCVSWSAHFTLAEYLLVCLPTSVTTCELLSLAWTHCASRRRRTTIAPAMPREKRSAEDV